MGPEVIFYSFAILIALVLIGVHIGIALGVTSFLGVYLITNNVDIALSTLGTTAYESIRNHALAVIPLFMLMGEIISRSGAATDLYMLCDRSLRKLPGRLAVATVIGNTAFAAVSGVAIASAATFSRIAYPEMRRMGYKKSYALGVITGSACLGMLIPPSVLMIIWAILTEGSVGALFIAGVIPGLLLGLTFIGYCVVAAMLDPSIAPAADQTHDKQLQQDAVGSEIIGALGVVALIIIVLGGLWGGIFTPTEAAGFGVLCSVFIGWIRGMRKQAFMEGNLRRRTINSADHVPVNCGVVIRQIVGHEWWHQSHPGYVCWVWPVCNWHDAHHDRCVAIIGRPYRFHLCGSDNRTHLFSNSYCRRFRSNCVCYLCDSCDRSRLANTTSRPVGVYRQSRCSRSFDNTWGNFQGCHSLLDNAADCCAVDPGPFLS